MSIRSCICCFCISMCGILSAQNLLPNPRFEHGEASYVVQAMHYPVKDIGLHFIPYEKGKAVEFTLYPVTSEGIRLPEFLMQPGIEYEFSGMVKESHLLGAGISNFKLDNDYVAQNWQGQPVNVKQANKWTPFSYRFKSDKKEPTWRAMTLCFWLPEEKAENLNGELPIISIADLYLGPAGKRDTLQNDSISVSMRLKDDPITLVFEPGEKIKVELHFINKREAQQNGKVEILTTGLREGRQLAVFDRSVSIPQGESMQEVELSAPVAYGLYKFSGKLDGKDFVNFSKVCVAPKVHVKKGELPVDIGSNGFISSTNNTPISSKEVDLFADAGFTYIRDWHGESPFMWDRMEPIDGKFEWTLADRQLDIMEKAGLELIPVVGPMFLRLPPDYPANKSSRFYNNLPPWLVDISPVAREFHFPAWEGNKTILPPLDKYERMVKAFGERYRGRIHVWEIMNESGSHMSAEENKTYLKPSYEILKQIEPSNIVLAGIITGDFGINMNDTLKKHIRAGALAYADGLVFHPYRSSYEDSPRSSDSMFDYFYGELKKANLNLTLWDTEIYYLAPTSKGGLDAAAQHFHPGYLVRRYLIDATQCCKCSTPLNGDAFLGNMINDNFQGDHPGVFFANRLLPNDKYVVSAVFAKTLKGTKFSDKLKTPDDFLFYKFNGEDRAVASLYALNVKENDTRSLSLAATLKRFPEVKATDVFGNPVQADTIKASPIPIYLSADSMASLDKFIAALTETSSSCANIGDNGRLLPFDNATVIAIPFKNYKNSELRGTLALQRDGKACAKAFEFTMPATSEQVLKIPMSQTIPTSLKLLAGNDAFEFPLKILPMGKTLRLEQEARLGKMSFKATCASGNLKLSFDVEDSTPSGEANGRSPWEQDCIEVFLDARPDLVGMKNSEEYTDYVARLFIIPYEHEGKRLLIWPGKLALKDVKDSISIKSNGYSAEIEIPLADLGLPSDPNGSIIGFDVKLDDARGQGKANSTEHWNSTGDAYKNRLSLGYIVFQTNSGKETKGKNLAQ